MAYIPPHKRHSKEVDRPLPTPELLAPQFKKNASFKGSSKSNVERTRKLIYADNAKSIWCTVGLDGGNKFPSSVNLEPVSLEKVEQKRREKPLALLNTSLHDGSEVGWNLPKSPWVYIADNVLEDLLSSFETVRNEMKCQKLEQVNPTLIVRVGKILFHRSPSANLESIQKDLTTEILNQWKRSFYTNVPVSYKENIENEVFPKIGIDFEGEKDVYQVKLSDSSRPDSILSCKCRVMKEHGKLQLYKIELNQLRNLVIDVSCPNKNLDLRLMLSTKRLVTSLSDDDMQRIRDLISCAVLDPDVKGGLRWHLGEDSSGDNKYKVVGVWHVTANMYRNSSLRLKVRHADRFNFWTSTGEASWETSLMLKKVVSKLQEEKVEVSSVSEILKEDMRLIWDNFLRCERSLT